MSDCVSLLVLNCIDLEAGDRVSMKRPLGYAHEAIVVDVDYDTGEVEVIEYGSDKGGFSLGKGVVQRKIYDVRGMYRWEYDECDDPNTVLERARSRIGERRYNPFTNNCEHFATWCKTGQGSCCQIPPFVARTCISGTSSVFAVGGTTASRVTSQCVHEAAKNGTTFVREVTDMLTCGGPGEVMDKICQAVDKGGKEIAERASYQLAMELGIPFALSVLTEGFLFMHNYHKAQKKYEERLQLDEDEHTRQTYEQERNREIKEAGCESIGGVIGANVAPLLATAVVGATAGGLVPIALAAFVGCAGGRLLGKVVGRWFFSNPTTNGTLQGV